MISGDKTQALQVLLGGLSAPLALRLAEAVERDRLGGGASLPHALILDKLTPALRKAAAMPGFAERAPEEILAALPVLAAGAFSGGPRMPDLSRPPDAQICARAFACARAIGGDAKMQIALRNYSENLLRELREGEARANAERYFEIATELTSILISAGEGELLLRRGRAARGAAA